MELETLLELADEAATEGEYEGAYHLLMAALHVAGIEALEAVAPPHRLSRDQARRRGHTALFDQLDVHAESVRLRLESAEEMRKRHIA